MGILRKPFIQGLYIDEFFLFLFSCWLAGGNIGKEVIQGYGYLKRKEI